MNKQVLQLGMISMVCGIVFGCTTDVAGILHSIFGVLFVLTGAICVLWLYAGYITWKNG